VTVAEALSAERAQQGVSINELAARSGMSPGRLHGILTGGTPNPGVLTVSKVLRAMGKDLKWLQKQLDATAP
jgi:transcriptional regulator with XRE-family HTH domain